jgi:Xaa-Pro aminopeptidase
MSSLLMDLPPGNVGTRVARLRQRLDESFSAEAMLVSSPANIRYLTGFTGGSTGLLVLPDALVLFTDNRYRLRALQTVSAPHLSHNVVEVVAASAYSGTLPEAVSIPKRLAVEADVLSWSQQTRLAETLAGVELVPTEGVLLADRLVKDAGEIGKMRAAAAISDAAFEELVTAEPIGWTEREIAAFLLERMIELGADDAAFEFIATTGANAAVPHAVCTKQRLGEGTGLLVDFGAEVGGYKADMSRTIWWGQPPDELQRMWDAVRRAHEAGWRAIQPGVSYGEVDAAARRSLAGDGLDEYFTHPTGHNVGLEIHERPYFAAGVEAPLACGHVVTVEPGVYLPGVGGVRIEDTFLVTEEGAVALTQARHGGSYQRQRASDPGGGHTADIPVCVDGGDGDRDGRDSHARFMAGGT